ncbi:MAG: hypothetical protein J2P27_00605 [Actinobacteria bacterium]|nr:hypothetical protein [Actinomycetota bacterium]
MLDAIDDALDQLEADPTCAACRQRSFGGGLWGITIRDRQDDWLVIWEPDEDDAGVVRVLRLDTAVAVLP